MSRKQEGLQELYDWIKEEERRETSAPSSLPENHPCYGCGNYGGICVDLCTKELFAELKEIQNRRKKNA